VVLVCTFPVKMAALEPFYQHLGKDGENRHYYISRNYLEQFFSIHNENDSFEIFLKELSAGKLTVMDTVSAWLGVNKNAVIHLTVEEMEIFVQLVEKSAEEDVFLNLMESNDGEMSIGRHIFLNSLIEIVRRFRNA